MVVRKLVLGAGAGAGPAARGVQGGSAEGPAG